MKVLKHGKMRSLNRLKTPKSAKYQLELNPTSGFYSQMLVLYAFGVHRMKKEVYSIPLGVPLVSLSCRQAGLSAVRQACSEVVDFIGMPNFTSSWSSASCKNIFCV